MTARATHIHWSEQWGARKEYQLEGNHHNKGHCDDNEPDQRPASPALNGKRDGSRKYQGNDGGLVGEVSQVSHADSYIGRTLTKAQKL